MGIRSPNNISYKLNAVTSNILVDFHITSSVGHYLMASAL
jgi:hypothetical protein